MDLQLFSVERAPRTVPTWDLILDDLGRPNAARIAKVLGIGRSTVYRWIEAHQAPKMACLALFWLTRWGHSEIHTSATNDAILTAQLARSLHEECQALRARLGVTATERDQAQTLLAKVLAIEGADRVLGEIDARGRPVPLPPPRIRLDDDRQLTWPNLPPETAGAAYEHHDGATTPSARQGAQAAPSLAELVARVVDERLAGIVGLEVARPGRSPESLLRGLNGPFDGAAPHAPASRTPMPPEAPLGVNLRDGQPVHERAVHLRRKVPKLAQEEGVTRTFLREPGENPDAADTRPGGARVARSQPARSPASEPVVTTVVDGKRVAARPAGPSRGSMRPEPHPCPANAATAVGNPFAAMTQQLADPLPFNPKE